MVGRSQPAGSRWEIHANENEDEWCGTRHVDAWNAVRRGNGRTGQGERFGVQPAIPYRHDQTPPGRDRYGERSLQGLWRRSGRYDLQVRIGRVRRPINRDWSHAKDARIGWQ